MPLEDLALKRQNKKLAVIRWGRIKQRKDFQNLPGDLQTGPAEGYRGFGSLKQPSLPFICSDLFWAGLLAYRYSVGWCAVFLDKAWWFMPMTGIPYCQTAAPAPVNVMAPRFWCPSPQNTNPSMPWYMLRLLWTQIHSELSSNACWDTESLPTPDLFRGIKYIQGLDFTPCLKIFWKISI